MAPTKSGEIPSIVIATAVGLLILLLTGKSPVVVKSGKFPVDTQQ